jgi:hypothetical protein
VWVKYPRWNLSGHFVGFEGDVPGQQRADTVDGVVGDTKSGDHRNYAQAEYLEDNQWPLSVLASGRTPAALRIIGDWI